MPKVWHAGGIACFEWPTSRQQFLEKYTVLPSIRSVHIWDVHICQFLIEGDANGRGCSCRLVSIKRVLIEGGNRRGHACWQLFNREGVPREGGSCW